MMRAIKINPQDQTVTEVLDFKGGLRALYEGLSLPGLQSVDDINMIQLTIRDVLWVDGEGLLKLDVPVWRLARYPNVLAGAGIILGSTSAGEDAGTMLDLKWVEENVSWTRQVTTGRLETGRNMSVGRAFIHTIGGPILRDAD